MAGQYPWLDGLSKLQSWWWTGSPHCNPLSWEESDTTERLNWTEESGRKSPTKWILYHHGPFWISQYLWVIDVYRLPVRGKLVMNDLQILPCLISLDRCDGVSHFHFDLIEKKDQVLNLGICTSSSQKPLWSRLLRGKMGPEMYLHTCDHTFTNLLSFHKSRYNSLFPISLPSTKTRIF